MASSVAAANHANSDHMAEEERQGLADSGVTPRSTCATSLACVSPPLKPATSPALSLWTRTRRPTSPSICPLRLPLRRSRPPLPRLRPPRRDDLYALNVDSA